MELDILKQNTTWNDASASINNNFAKVKTALEQGGGTGGGGSIAVDKEMSDTSENAVSNKTIKKYVDDEVEDAKAYSEEMADNAEKAAKLYTDEKVKNSGGGGGVSLPVVSSEEELESLSQNKGDLAVILSDDEVKNGNVRCLDLPTISVNAVQAYDFSECASVQGIAINTEVDVPPCPAFAGQNIQFIIAPRNMSGLSSASYLGFDLSEPFDEDGYCRGTLQVTMIQGGSGSSAIPLAQYDETTGKMVLVDDGAIEELNSLVIGTMLEDPVLVSITEMVEFGGEGLKDTLAFFECISSVVKLGTKAIRVKNDDGYSRLDSDVIRTIPKDAVPNLEGLKMPNASQVRVYFPDETVYDTDPKDFKCCITEPSINTANATVVNKIEFIKTCDTTISSGSNPLPPYIILCNQSLDKSLAIRWVAGETAPYKAMYSEDEWATSVILLENGVWNEENLEALDAIIASGVNILFELGKNNENGSGSDVNIYNPKTGVMTYLEDYGEDGILTEDELAAISLMVTMLFGSYFTIFANERVIPEHIESYSRLEGKWVKDEMEIETEWSESLATSNKPIASSLFVALMRDYEADVQNRLDSKQPKLVSGENIATVNGKSLLEGGNIVIEGGEGGSSNITVDDALSTTSTNPVQNAVITNELNKKVNAESGKGLSTNDYTTTEKSKLAGIESGAQKNPTFATINGHRIDQGGEIVVEGGGMEEVYIGDSEPTDDNIKVWIDTSAEGGTSGGGNTSGTSGASFSIYLSEPITEDSSSWFYWAKDGQYSIAQYVKGKKATEVRTSNPSAVSGLDVPMAMIELDFSKIHTNLTFPNVVWKDEAAPTFEDGAKYLVKVFNGMAEWGKYGSIRVFDFKIAGNACQALEGMTWGQYIDSKYNIYGFYWDGSTIRNPQWGSSVYIAEAPSKTTLIVEGKNYTTANGAVFPI